MASFLHPGRLDILGHCLSSIPYAHTTPEALRTPSRTALKMGLIDAKNKVPEHQRHYQQAYRAHTRLWKIGSRSRWYMTPYLVVLWGGFGAAMYAAGRKVTGHNTWFGKD
ncbi:bacteriophage N adsorption protein A c-term domain-containing protein [Purpureocillium lavendulum]|uniref:Bacteriophage N adsorption protein A c-term domain-containing protein n=1 Tax=Purpureocillium lavendulum TaxID=1247861 RepID=A0AB34FZH8_9HYPO|nr:bacteriophage N adsorption protein A c-term domain-containing protein [Purpureocillium lavendulum]